MTFWSCYNNKKNIKGKKGQQASRHMVEEDTKKKKRENKNKQDGLVMSHLHRFNGRTTSDHDEILDVNTLTW